MKILKSTCTGITFVAAILFAAQLCAQDVIYKGTPPGGGSLVKIEGTSSLHPWTVEGKMIGGKMQLEQGFDADLKTLKKTPAINAIIPVRSLQDADKKTEMDNVMYQAMRATNFANIEYRLLDLKSKDGKFEATGALTVAGVTKTNTMPVTFERVDNSKIKVSGSTALKMTDFNVKPPVLGVAGVSIKTGDDVKLSLEWVVKKAEAPK